MANKVSRSSSRSSSSAPRPASSSSTSRCAASAASPRLSLELTLFLERPQEKGVGHLDDSLLDVLPQDADPADFHLSGASLDPPSRPSLGSLAHSLLPCSQASSRSSARCSPSCAVARRRRSSSSRTTRPRSTSSRRTASARSIPTADSTGASRFPACSPTVRRASSDSLSPLAQQDAADGPHPDGRGVQPRHTEEPVCALPLSLSRRLARCEPCADAVRPRSHLPPLEQGRRHGPQQCVSLFLSAAASPRAPS